MACPVCGFECVLNFSTFFEIGKGNGVRVTVCACCVAVGEATRSMEQTLAVTANLEGCRWRHFSASFTPGDDRSLPKQLTLPPIFCWEILLAAELTAVVSKWNTLTPDETPTQYNNVTIKRSPVGVQAQGLTRQQQPSASALLIGWSCCCV